MSVRGVFALIVLAWAPAGASLPLFGQEAGSHFSVAAPERVAGPSAIPERGVEALAPLFAGDPRYKVDGWRSLARPGLVRASFEPVPSALNPTRQQQAGHSGQDGSFRPGRFWWGTGAALGADAATLVGLSRIWYTDYERTRFHWHNDWDNWLQQDKLGHVVTAWHLGRLFGAYGKWSGLTRQQAAMYGGAFSFFYLSQVEILDGFSEGWGASLPDLLANATGAGIGAMTVADPRFRAVTMKWSYRTSPYEDPELNVVGDALKDYDGATFWLVIRPASLDAVPDWWPSWLGLSVGHSADGLARALPTPESPHRRVWLIAPDLDLLETIHWPARWMRQAGRVLSFVRLPAPALRVTPDLKWYLLYF